jgi:hypothetical protein
MEGTGLRLGFVLEKASKGEMESKNDLLGGGAADGAGKENDGVGSGPSKLPSCSFCTGGDTLGVSLVLLSCELRRNILALCSEFRKNISATSCKIDVNLRTQ